MNRKSQIAEMKMATRPEKEKPNKVHELRIRKADNGGHVVEHVYENNGMGYKAPDVHAFGDDQGGDALAHVGEWMGVPNAKEEKGEKEHVGKLKEEKS